MKVNWVFKAKKVAFRGRNRAKVEKFTFCIPQSQKSLRDFFESKSENSVDNFQGAWGDFVTFGRKK